MPSPTGSYLIGIAPHVEPRFSLLLEELEEAGALDKFLKGLDRLAAAISQGDDPDDSGPVSGRPGFWNATVEGIRLSFSVNEEEEWVIVEHIPGAPAGGRPGV